MNPTFMYGTLLALNDVFMMPFVKQIAHGGWSTWMLIFPMLAYALNPIIFYFALQHECMTTMNLVWDLTSDVLVTLIGITVFNERLSTRKYIGVALSFIAMCLMSC